MKTPPKPDGWQWKRRETLVSWVFGAWMILLLPLSVTLFAPEWIAWGWAGLIAVSAWCASQIAAVSRWVERPRGLRRRWVNRRWTAPWVRREVTRMYGR